jgi:hypothetical protein
VKSNDEPIGDRSWQGAVVPWSENGELVPHLLLAERLDSCVDVLSTWLDEQPGSQAREAYLDLLVGLCVSAEAMRAMARGDLPNCIEHMESAVHHLEHVGAGDISIPSSPSWY